MDIAQIKLIAASNRIYSKEFRTLHKIHQMNVVQYLTGEKFKTAEKQFVAVSFFVTSDNCKLLVKFSNSGKGSMLGVNDYIVFSFKTGENQSLFLVL